MRRDVDWGGEVELALGWGETRRVRWGLLGVAALLLGLHFVHLNADMPNGAVWLDSARFTDEGWYGDAAVRWALSGRWRVPGDLNTAAVMPVWPLMEALPFWVFGVHLWVARALSVLCFAGACAGCWVFLRQAEEGRRSLAPEVAVLLLLASPFGFAFSRVAALEPALVLAVVWAMVLAGRGERSGWALVGMGVLLPGMVLTKSTAVVAIPAVLWIWWRRLGTEGRTGSGLWRAGRWIALPALAVSAVYGGWVWRAGLAGDIHTYFLPLGGRVNHRNGVPTLLKWLGDLRWLGAGMSLVGGAAFVSSCRRLGRDALTESLWLLGGMYLLFTAYKGNLQPRYLLLMLVVLAMTLARELGAWMGGAAWKRATAWGLVVAVAGMEMVVTVGFVLHPRYSWYGAAGEIARTVRAERGGAEVLQGSSAAEIGLMTGLPHVAGELTTWTTPALAERYGVGWMCAWVDPGGSARERAMRTELEPYFELREERRFEVMEDPARHTLVLYRLERRRDAPEPPLLYPEGMVR